MNKISAACVLAGTALLVSGLPYKMDIKEYGVQSAKVRKPFRTVILADLHCIAFGKGQRKLLEQIEKLQPDLILIPGDLFDVDRNFENSFDLVRGLQKYPVFFTSGNHDNYLDEMDQLRERLRDLGVIVLENETITLQVNNQLIEIAGLSDHGRRPLYTPEQTDALFHHPDSFQILMSHRPEFMDFYRQLHADMIVCGHAHGGQVRIPFTKQGLYAPQQGFFPKYTEGVIDDRIVISRGLASGNPWLPRLFNNPEITVVDAAGEEQ